MATMIRVAHLRATTLRPWDLGNYVSSQDVDAEFFVSRSSAAAMQGYGLTMHALPSIGDVVARLPPYAQIAAYHFAGSAEHLRGLEHAVRGFDVVHTVETYFPITEQAVRIKDGGGCRAVVCTVMENIAFWPAQNRWVERRVRRNAAGVDHFVAITERAALHIETAGVPEERITVLPAGVDTTRFAPSERPREHKGPLRILTVSRLERGKGVEDLAVAVGLLARRGVDVDVTYVGEGPSRAAIERIGHDYGVSGRLHFAGGVPWERVHELHAAHDLFVLASAPTSNWREQYGYAVVEAMSSGLPVLVGDSGSLMEVAGRTDALVTPHDPLSLAARIEVLAMDAGLRDELARFNRDRVLERFDVVDVRGRLAALYARTLDAVGQTGATCHPARP